MLKDHLACHLCGFFSHTKLLLFTIHKTEFLLPNFVLHLVNLLLPSFFSSLFQFVFRFSISVSCYLFPALPELSSSVCSHQFDWFWRSSSLMFFLHFKGSSDCYCLLHNPIDHFRQLVWHHHVFCCFCMHSLFSL